VVFEEFRTLLIELWERRREPRWSLRVGADWEQDSDLFLVAEALGRVEIKITSCGVRWPVENLLINLASYLSSVRGRNLLVVASRRQALDFTPRLTGGEVASLYTVELKPFTPAAIYSFLLRWPYAGGARESIEARRIFNSLRLNPTLIETCANPLALAGEAVIDVEGEDVIGVDRLDAGVTDAGLFGGCQWVGQATQQNTVVDELEQAAIETYGDAAAGEMVADGVLPAGQADLAAGVDGAVDLDRVAGLARGDGWWAGGAAALVEQPVQVGDG
jgi:hypothetical protein